MIRHHAKPVIRTILMIVVLAFLAVQLQSGLADLDLTSITFHPWYLLGAIAFLQLGLMTNVFLMRYTFAFLNRQIAFRDAYSIFFVSNLGRYIPGKLWQIVALSHLARRRGITLTDSASLFVTNQFIMIGGGMLFVLVFGFVLSETYTFPLPVVALLLSLLLLFIAFPSLISTSINLILGLFRQQALAYAIDRKYLVSVTGLGFVTYALTGFGFFLLSQGLDARADDLYFMISVYPLAYILGYLTLISPGGIGVREVIIVFLLNHQFPPDTSALLALSSLIWFTLVELCNSLLAFNTLPELQSHPTTGSDQDA